MRIAHVSTFPATRCGIANYAADLVAALPTMRNAKYALHRGKNLTADAAGHADVNDYLAVRALAKAISRSAADVVCLQHEYGIWGGGFGVYLLDFLERIKKPIVSTLHTTHAPGVWPVVAYDLLRTLVTSSATTVVLTPASRDTLCQALQLPLSAVQVMPHGVPDLPFVPLAAPSKPTEPWRFCGIGFFRANKGIEETMHALAMLKKEGLPVRYTMAGSPQPQDASQASYLVEMNRLAKKLGLQGLVRFQSAFLSVEEQAAVIRSSHAGIFAHQAPGQASSGTVPLVLASGRPVICSPFQFALAKRQELGKAVTITKGFDPAAIAGAIRNFIARAPQYDRLCKDVYARTRSWRWNTVGAAYATALRNAKESSRGERAS